MDSGFVDWGRATLRWMPEQSYGSAQLEVDAYIEGYAAAILSDDLRDALLKIARGTTEFEVGVSAGRREQIGGGFRFDPGKISITAERLTEAFDAAQLHDCVQHCVDAAVREGDLRAEQDETRAREYLQALYDASKGTD